MWDNPGALNRLSDLLFAGAALLVLYWVIRFAIHQPVFALTELRVLGTNQISREQAVEIVKRDLKGTFFTLDITRLRASFEKLPWVRRADVRRQWPDRIDVVVEEHQPLAHWGAKGVQGGGALVNRQGEVFTAALEASLPRLSGPAGTSLEVTTQYARMLESFATINRVPAEVHLSQRGAWRVKLDNGMILEVGREQMEARLARFIAVYPRTVAPLKRRIEYVDLRYGNGFAVRVPEVAHMKDAPARQAHETAPARSGA